MKKHKSICCLMVSLLLAGLLAGCGQEDTAAGWKKPVQGVTDAPLVEIPTEAGPSGEVPVVTESQTEVPPATQEQTVVSETTGPSQLSDPNLINRMDDAMRYELNVFLSNFAEAYFYNYPIEEYTLLSFVLTHTKINNSSAVTSEGGYYVLTKEHVDSILYRFFGKTVTPAEPTCTYPGPFDHAHIYENGRYKFEAADGATYTQFALADIMLANDDGTYTVYYTIYSVDIEVYFESGIPAGYYHLTPAEAAAHGNITPLRSGTAVVRDYMHGDRESYQVIELKQ